VSHPKIAEAAVVGIPHNIKGQAGGVTMFSLDNVLDDLWPQARPAPWQKSLLKRLFYEEEFQQFAAQHRHLKGLDMVEQVLEHLEFVWLVGSN
jgi:acyl-CoA synthetase (AMP-forming)/AMP-acid ligase II